MDLPLSPPPPQPDLYDPNRQFLLLPSLLSFFYLSVSLYISVSLTVTHTRHDRLDGKERDLLFSFIGVPFSSKLSIRVSFFTVSFCLSFLPFFLSVCMSVCLSSVCLSTVPSTCVSLLTHVVPFCSFSFCVILMSFSFKKCWKNQVQYFRILPSVKNLYMLYSVHYVENKCRTEISKPNFDNSTFSVFKQY